MDKPNNDSSGSAANQDSVSDKKLRRYKIVFRLTVLLIIVWLAGDWAYSRIVASHLAQWESGIERNENRVRVGCESYTAGDGEDAILLVHGINDSPYIYHKMVPELVKSGYTCRAVRLPGFAMPIEDYGKYRLEDWTKAIKREIQELRGKHRKVFLISHSLGGAISINVLLDQPELVDRVVLLAPAVDVSSRRSPLFSTQTWHSIGNALLMFTKVTESPFGYDAHDPAEQEYEMGTIFSPRSVIDETFRVIELNRGRAKEFKTPLKLVVSKDDQIIDWEAARDFYQQCSSEPKSLDYCPDAGHAIPVDYHWKELTAKIVAFFDQETNGINSK